jgi:hypothetical protein
MAPVQKHQTKYSAYAANGAPKRLLSGHEVRSWARLIALCVGVLAVVTAALALSAPTIDLIVLR